MINTILRSIVYNPRKSHFHSELAYSGNTPILFLQFQPDNQWTPKAQAKIMKHAPQAKWDDYQRRFAIYFSDKSLHDADQRAQKLLKKLWGLDEHIIYRFSDRANDRTINLTYNSKTKILRVDYPHKDLQGCLYALQGNYLLVKKGHVDQKSIILVLTRQAIKNLPSALSALVSRLPD